MGAELSAEVIEAHRVAEAAGEDGYIDPSTGYWVFTATYLGGRPCCGNICRHCPWQQ